jgi:hypothetical protein
VTGSGGFRSFTGACTNGEVAPIPAVRWTGRTERPAAGSGYFVDAPLIVPIDNLWVARADHAMIGPEGRFR